MQCKQLWIKALQLLLRVFCWQTALDKHNSSHKEPLFGIKRIYNTAEYLLLTVLGIAFFRYVYFANNANYNHLNLYICIFSKF